ncbi:hypothetical protein HUT08_04070 [Streptomyces buecherae]|uniref:Zinc finger CHC2-type domain-containing protein n=1 Tax=Streptomyces buecherae TaxID=2763006 RepID=A0A7H8N340_9ACTN|nr:hypothetical protein HUT08_04070 [Streptomyces buecherae]
MKPINKPPIETVLAYYKTNWQAPHAGTSVGAWLACLCPFHVEEKASAAVNYETERVHCFACGVSLDSIGVIQREEEATFVEATRIAESRFGSRREAIQQPVPRKRSRPIYGASRAGRTGGTVPGRLRFRSDYRA